MGDKPFTFHTSMAVVSLYPWNKKFRLPNFGAGDGKGMGCLWVLRQAVREAYTSAWYPRGHVERGA